MITVLRAYSAGLMPLMATNKLDFVAEFVNNLNFSVEP